MDSFFSHPAYDEMIIYGRTTNTNNKQAMYAIENSKQSLMRWYCKKPSERFEMRSGKEKSENTQTTLRTNSNEFYTKYVYVYSYSFVRKTTVMTNPTFAGISTKI